MSRTTFTEAELQSLVNKGHLEVARLAAKELDDAERHLQHARELLKLAEAKEQS
jgi:hypothetical protein